VLSRIEKIKLSKTSSKYKEMVTMQGQLFPRNVIGGDAEVKGK
jgi:hypothetical protein